MEDREEGKISRGDVKGRLKVSQGPSDRRYPDETENRRIKPTLTCAGAR